MSAPLLDIAGLDVSHDGGATFAVKNADLAVSAGQFVALVGASGSGKTSLLKCVNRLAEPFAGEVRFAGAPNHALPPHELRRRIGYVFQGVGLFPHMSVGENIAITPRLLGQDETAVAARVDELLDLVGLPRQWASRRPHQLSGGQRQRVGIARALAAKPKLMLMDEPFGALDPVTRDALGSAYRRLHDELGLTTLMVTHDIGEAVLLAGRMVVLACGHIVADDTPRALMRASGPPEVSALMAVPRDQFARVSRILDG